MTMQEAEPIFAMLILGVVALCAIGVWGGIACEEIIAWWESKPVKRKQTRSRKQR